MKATRLPWVSPRRAGGLLLAIFALWACHRFTGVSAARDFWPLVQGYSDRDLLTPGGDLALQLVVTQQATLRAAIMAAGLVLLLGRLPSFVAVFFLHRVAYSLGREPVAAPDARGGPAERRPLHTGLALALMLGVTLASFAHRAALVYLALRCRTWLGDVGVEARFILLASVFLVLGLVWIALELWFDLYQLAIAGARAGFIRGAREATRSWRRSFFELAPLRALLAVCTATLLVAGVLSLPAITRSTSEPVWGALAVDLGLLGATCLRAAWLAYASAALVTPPSTSDIKEASFSGVPPSGAPDAPDDPNPNPASSPA